MFQTTERAMAAAPLFSIVIPSHGRPGPLAACLGAIRQSDFPADDFEIVVVDDGTPAPLDAGVPGADGHDDLRWVRLPAPAGPAAARNAGAGVARGKYLAFIDDDCLAERAWLSRLSDALRSNPGCAVGGRLTDGSGGSLYCAADQAILDVAYAYYNLDPAHARFLGTANLAVPADAFRELGGFNPEHRTAEDREFCARWLATGRRLFYAADAVTVHAATSSLRRSWSRHCAFGAGAYQFRSRYARLPDGKISLEPASFYRRLLLSPFERGLGVKAVLVSCLVVLSQVASAGGFLTARHASQTSKGRTA